MGSLHVNVLMFDFSFCLSSFVSMMQLGGAAIHEYIVKPPVISELPCLTCFVSVRSQTRERTRQPTSADSNDSELWLYMTRVTRKFTLLTQMGSCIQELLWILF